MTDKAEVCRNCRFYFYDGGECKRRSPITDGERKAIWPKTNPIDWCGEFDLSYSLRESLGLIPKAKNEKTAG
jgi:hypothetical protein